VGISPFADLFIFFFPISFLETIARETNRYGNKDWVCPIVGLDDDSSLLDFNDRGEEAGDEPKSKDVLKACLQSHPKARHCFKGLSKQWKHATPGFSFVYFGIICFVGATKI
jgi:hypothetical protein